MGFNALTTSTRKSSARKRAVAMKLFNVIGSVLDAVHDALNPHEQQELDEVTNLYDQLESDSARDDFIDQAATEGYVLHFEPDGSRYFVYR